jgi:hypothetical protein
MGPMAVVEVLPFLEPAADPVVALGQGKFPVISWTWRMSPGGMRRCGRVPGLRSGCTRHDMVEEWMARMTSLFLMEPQMM